MTRTLCQLLSSAFQLFDSSTPELLDFLGLVLCFHIHSRFVRQKTFLNNQLSAPSHAIPGWRKPYFVGLRCPEGTGQAERHNLTAQSDRAGARLILAYKLTFSLPRNFPVVEYLGDPTASLKGWRNDAILGNVSGAVHTKEAEGKRRLNRFPSRDRKSAWSG